MARTAKEMHTALEPDSVCATQEIMAVVKTWLAAKRRRLAAEAVEERLGNQIRSFMDRGGEHTILMDPSGSKMLATYKCHDVEKFNEKLFAKQHPTIYKKYLRDVPYCTLRAK